MGTVFDIDLRLERDPQTRDLVQRPHGTHMAYTAVLGSADEFAPVLWALAWRHSIPTAADSSVTADGADWIWRLVADLFPNSVEIVDWYHACQHLNAPSGLIHLTKPQNCAILVMRIADREYSPATESK